MGASPAAQGPKTGYYRRVWRRALAIGLLALGACAQSEVIEVDLGGPQQSGLAVVVLLDEVGAPTRTLAPIALERGRLLAGQRPDLAINERESAALAVVIAEPDLDVLLPGRKGSLLDVRLSIEPPPAVAGYEVVGQPPIVERSAALPDVARLIHFSRGGTNYELYPNDDERDRLVAQLRLTAVVDPEYCRSPYGPLEPYGNTEVPFLGEQLPEVKTIFRIDDRRAVFAAPDEVYLVRRGEAFTRTGTTGEPQNAIRIRAVDLQTPVIKYVRTVAVTRQSGSPTRVWVLATGATTLEPRIYENAVYELGLDARGLTFIGTSTRSVGIVARDLAAAPDGELAMTRDDDTVWFRDPTTAAWSKTQLPTVLPRLEDDVRLVVSVPDPEISWMTGTRGRVHRFSRSTRTWDLEDAVIRGIGASRFAGIAAGRGEGGTEYWVGSDAIFRSTGRQFEEQRVELPPSYAPCAIQAPPYRLDSAVSAMEIEDGYLYFTTKSCWAVFAARIDDLCISLITRPDGATPSALSVLDLDLRDGELLLGAAGGRIASSKR